MRLLPIAAALMVAGAGLVMSAGAANAAVAASCPTVDPGTGLVTPAPTSNVDWSGCDLSGADLEVADLVGADLSGSNLANADLGGANLENANLSSATATDASFRTAYLGGANLSSGDFTGADLSDTIVRDSNIASAVFADANLSRVESDDSVTGLPASLPANWLVLDNDLIGPTAVLIGDDLKGADLSGRDLAGVNLLDADLANANLAGTSLQGAALINLDLVGANLSGTDMTGANPDALHAARITGNPKALPAHWVELDGFLLGPQASMTEEHLEGLDLTGINLAGADFFDASLFGADLAGVNLSGADFTQADLRGADLFGADVSGASWHGTACPGLLMLNGLRCALAFPIGRFTVPRPNSVIQASARSFVVRFSLVATQSGKKISSSYASALAKDHEVRVSLHGSKMKTVRSYCSWVSAKHQFQCTVKIPRNIKTGKSHPYLLHIQEKPGQIFVDAFRASPRFPNPEAIYFR